MVTLTVENASYVSELLSARWRPYWHILSWEYCSEVRGILQRFNGEMDTMQVTGEVIQSVDNAGKPFSGRCRAVNFLGSYRALPTLAIVGRE